MQESTEFITLWSSLSSYREQEINSDTFFVVVVVVILARYSQIRLLLILITIYIDVLDESV